MIVIVLLFVLTGVCVLIWVLCVFFGMARASLMRCSAQLFSVRPLCVLEQPRVDNYSTYPLKRGTQLGTIGPVGLRPALSTY